MYSALPRISHPVSSLIAHVMSACVLSRIAYRARGLSPEPVEADQWRVADSFLEPVPHARVRQRMPGAEA